MTVKVDGIAGAKNAVIGRAAELRTALSLSRLSSIQQLRHATAQRFEAAPRARAAVARAQPGVHHLRPFPITDIEAGFCAAGRVSAAVTAPRVELGKAAGGE